MVKIIKSINEIREQVKTWQREGLKVGFVPTMGYLHEGHQSLIKKADIENDKVIISIFVNPIQFGANEDLDSYPRDLKRDSIIAEEAGANIIFHPNVNEMYPEKLYTFVNVNNLDKELCGASRDGHFQGVCTVVSKLFNIVPADKAYFGRKDAQQLAIIQKMVKDLNFDIEVIPCDIIRENDGLAKSSRNKYLSTEERKAALILSTTLNSMKNKINSGEIDVKNLINFAKDEIAKEKLAKIDYIQIVDLFTLESVSTIKKSILVAMAVYIGNTRLIDNFSFEV